MANQACSLHAGIGLGRDAINEKFIEAVRELETPRDREVAFQIDIDKKILIQGFSALRMSEFMRVCADYGKRFTIPYAREKQPSLQIKIDDRKDHIAVPVNSTTEDEFAEILQTKYDLQFQSKIRSGSIVVFRMQPSASTTSEQMEDLLASTCVLNVEVSPAMLNISYIVPRAWPLSLKQLKQRHPEKFNAAGKRRGKRGSIYRRFTV